ncbi:MAG: DUF2238 domain-containing protein [Gammaproteobacteria bacterium]|nr:DUF2238 domain-containing protein [Gammaproteobacteria bacterium]
MNYIWILIYIGVLVWSGIGPKDYMTWGLEVAPAVIGLVIIAFTYQRFKLTPLLNTLILIHAIILMVGGHYTYAEVPIGDWVSEWFGSERNNYDKLGHFMQGFMPAILARELLIRLNVVSKKGWLFFICIAICLGFSAFYELIEWWVALLSDEAADSFLGTQGYVWDTQSDMFWALIGATSALVCLGKLHSAQLKS